MGIDPETLRLVAQCFNHYATPGPLRIITTCEIRFMSFWIWYT
jgi:hypothetical protein